MALLQTERLTKIYGSGSAAVTALSQINLRINAQELVAIMGPSGCGKSTLLHLLGGLDTPTEGRVLLDGVDLSTLNDTALTITRREKIGFVFQFFNLIPVLSSLENVMLPLALGARPKDSGVRATEWLTRLGLADRLGNRPDQLSGGQQQRVALARALVTEPVLILADEPTGNLDSRAADEMLHLLRQTVDEWGRTVVMVTHDARMAAYADRIIFLKDGTMVDDTRLTSMPAVEDAMLKMETVSNK
jgi:putative ABC transport system ATP-binding protein